jgi:hypothetical protein
MMFNMQGTNFWVVNHLPWYAGGVHQCVCTHIREGFDGVKVTNTVDQPKNIHLKKCGTCRLHNTI